MLYVLHKTFPVPCKACWLLWGSAYNGRELLRLESWVMLVRMIVQNDRHRKRLQLYCWVNLVSLMSTTYDITIQSSVLRIVCVCVCVCVYVVLRVSFAPDWSPSILTMASPSHLGKAEQAEGANMQKASCQTWVGCSYRVQDDWCWPAGSVRLPPRFCYQYTTSDRIRFQLNKIEGASKL